MGTNSSIDPAIILFDGVCNLCNASVQLIIRNDRNKYFRFASLQSDFGMAIMKQYGRPVHELNSILLLKEKTLYDKSDAALEIARHMDGAWKFLIVFKFIPKPIRDSVYLGVAKNRYRWFGQKNECMIPTPELKNLFIS